MKKALLIFAAALLCACTPDGPAEPSGSPGFELSPKSLAGVFASLPLGPEQLREVRSAVSLSSGWGYDEEYTLRQLVDDPGSGVGSEGRTRAAGQQYSRPLRDMLSEYFADHELALPGHAPSTRAGEVEDLLAELAASGYQIYWPYSEEWDGETYPVITWDPGYGAESNTGYALAPGPDGAYIADTLIVNEAMAQTRPVWVVNSNTDAGFTPLDFFIPKYGAAETRSEDVKCLKLKSFKMKRNYDTWFCGASEFVFRIGYIAGFNANAFDDLKNYSPSVTEFSLVVKRRDVDKEIPYDALLVAGLSDQMESLALLVTEDDGGTRTSWKGSIGVKVASKSYGIDVDLPFSDKDDLVWRGQLPIPYFASHGPLPESFGDVEICFAVE